MIGGRRFPWGWIAFGSSPLLPPAIVFVLFRNSTGPDAVSAWGAWMLAGFLSLVLAISVVSVAFARFVWRDRPPRTNARGPDERSGSDLLLPHQHRAFAASITVVRKE